MATHTATRVAAEKVAEMKARSDGNGQIPQSIVAELREARSKGVSLAELRKLHPDLKAETIRAAVADLPAARAPKPFAAAQTSKKGQTGVETKRVRPVEPDYSKLPEAKREEARAKYEEALRAFEKGEPAPKTPKAPATAPKASIMRVISRAVSAERGDLSYGGWSR
jgi:hypothetical protein